MRPCTAALLGLLAACNASADLPAEPHQAAITAGDLAQFPGLYWLPAEGGTIAWRDEYGPVQIFAVAAEEECGKRFCRACIGESPCSMTPPSLPRLPPLGDKPARTFELPPLPAGGLYLIQAERLPVPPPTEEAAPPRDTTVSGHATLVATYPHQPSDLETDAPSDPTEACAPVAMVDGFQYQTICVPDNPKIPPLYFELPRLVLMRFIHL